MNIVEEIGIIHNESGFGIIHEVRVDTGEHYARKTFKPIGADRLDPNGLVSLKKDFLEK